ncbi:MAG: hypothetical protein IH989_02420 [Planctomycetes bacterium]|nr:hypothetical protein [Planctomycetota bacterium]
MAVERAAAREKASKEFVKAQSEADQRDTRKVIADCTRAIELEPDLALAYALRAKALTRQNKNDAAWHDCTKALELDRTNSLALRTKGYLLAKRGNFDAALVAYDQGIRATRNEYLAEDFHNRARLRRISGDDELALADHNAAVALAPEKALVYLSRSVTRRFAGDMDRALEDLSRAAFLSRRLAHQSYLWIWEIRMLRGDPGDRDAAKAALEQAEAALEADRGAGTYAFDKKILDVCRGRLTTHEMVAEAGTNPLLRCIACYYLGARALVEGRRPEAKTFFQDVRDTEIYTHLEYDLAKWHLQQLGAD